MTPRLVGPDGRPLVGRQSVLMPVPPKADGSYLIQEGCTRFALLADTYIVGVPVCRLEQIAGSGERLLTTFVCEYLALCASHLVGGAVSRKVPARITVGTTDYVFQPHVDPCLPDTLDICLTPLQKPPDWRKPRGKPIRLRNGSHFKRCRLYVPANIRGFRGELGVSIAKGIIEYGCNLLEERLILAIAELGGSLPAKLYRCLKDVSGTAEGVTFSALPRGKEGQIVYLLDTERARTLTGRAVGRSRDTGLSALNMASEFAQNRVDYDLVHARHAIEGGKPWRCDLEKSLYRDDFDVFTEAELAWYGTSDILIDPIVNFPGRQDLLVAVYEPENALVAGRLRAAKNQLTDVFCRHKRDAARQLSQLNARRFDDLHFSGDLVAPEQKRRLSFLDPESHPLIQSWVRFAVDLVSLAARNLTSQ